jgi:hypothetical protein
MYVEYQEIDGNVNSMTVLIDFLSEKVECLGPLPTNWPDVREAVFAILKEKKNAALTPNVPEEALSESLRRGQTILNNRPINYGKN